MSSVVDMPFTPEYIRTLVAATIIVTAASLTPAAFLAHEGKQKHQAIKIEKP